MGLQTKLVECVKRSEHFCDLKLKSQRRLADESSYVCPISLLKPK